MPKMVQPETARNVLSRFITLGTHSPPERAGRQRGPARAPAQGTYFSVLATDDMEAAFQSASDESASSQERHGRDNTDPNISYRAEDRRS